MVNQFNTIFFRQTRQINTEGTKMSLTPSQQYHLRIMEPDSYLVKHLYFEDEKIYSDDDDVDNVVGQIHVVLPRGSCIMIIPVYNGPVINIKFKNEFLLFEYNGSSNLSEIKSSFFRKYFYNSSFPMENTPMPEMTDRYVKYMEEWFTKTETCGEIVHTKCARVK